MLLYNKAIKHSLELYIATHYPIYKRSYSKQENLHIFSNEKYQRHSKWIKNHPFLMC